VLSNSLYDLLRREADIAVRMAEPTHILTRRLSVRRASCQRSFPAVQIFPDVQGQLPALGKPSLVCDPEGPLVAHPGNRPEF
jgi:hypothetical protein